MILYSIVPPETILEGYESFKPEYRELDIPGRKVLIEPHPRPRTPGAPDRPCPNDYLRPSTSRAGLSLNQKSEAGCQVANIVTGAVQ